ncbi:MAG TPA: aldo/keto reductase [Actinospica sp.]|nr:aldo/keto reductase [Actinospica sp.]
MRAAQRRVILGLYRARPTRQLLQAALDLGLTALDTAYNYQHFDGHRALAAAAGELLDRFEISTKVGFFPDGHSLEPARLHAAVEQTVSELGRAPNTVLLHNPECSPQAFQRACETLTGMRDAGFCQAWGLSSWNPMPLLAVASRTEPDVLMVRAGLTVPARDLDAAVQLAARLQPKQLWGMAPFGGNATDSVWSTVDTSQFLEPGQDATRLQAAFAAAFTIPKVTAVAVGTQHPCHLEQLRHAAQLRTDPNTIARYTALITRRHKLVEAATTEAQENAPA